MYLPHKCQLAAQKIICLLICMYLSKCPSRITPTLVFVGYFHYLGFHLLSSWHFKILHSVHTCQGVLVKWCKTCVYVHITGLAVLESVLDIIPHREKLYTDLSDTHSILFCLQWHWGSYWHRKKGKLKQRCRLWWVILQTNVNFSTVLSQFEILFCISIGILINCL